MRKVAVITGTRAEYGLLFWVIKGIHETPELELQLIVTGMHLSPEFGLTVREIEKGGFPIVERVEMLLSSDTEVAIATSMGLGMIGFANTYDRLKPDIVLVLGDRFEISAAVSAAVPFGIPVAHIHGGESTEGVMDELFRHAITKMSHIHFPSTQKYADRVVQMGERPENIFCFGAPGLDSIHSLQLLKKQELANELKLPVEKPWGIMTYHPVTYKNNSDINQFEVILDMVGKFSEIYWIFTLPNADTGSRKIIEQIEAFVHNNSEIACLFNSLGQLRYLSLLKNASLMIGNSSSGIIEAPSFELPVVNIGDRQKGRIRAANVIDVPVCEQDEIEKAINKAVSKDFRDSITGLENPYGTGNASEKIVEILRTVSLSDMSKKQFCELSKGCG
ncbi:MAG: UDP-N-acetylglucosamine 2-epimerase (hydrolyzing) [Candidatus Scalindua sp.]|jgi:GDP/UDP-N,N'-diacetylbacillosamine 2-epimerase (hydrolysing)|nr:UDP-N-acetylglucosamine 2-epimerase (hydrolyzing) [Candidatus Scalindua sp.]